MSKFLTVIVVTLVLFINVLPLSALARSERQGGNWLRGRGDGRGNVWVDTSRWETRRVQVEAARAARYENRTVLVSPARTETRIIPEVRENRTRWIPPVTERRWTEVAPSRPAVSEQGHWAERTVPAVWGTERRWIEPVMGRRWGETRAAVPAVTERRWFVTQEGQSAQYSWVDAVIIPGRTETRWIPPVTREERFRDIEVITWTERVRVREAGFRRIPGAWGPFPYGWFPAEYENRLRTATREVQRTRTVVVTPGRNETVWIPPVTERRRVRIREAIPERGEWRTVIVTPAQSAQFGWIDFEQTPGHFVNVSVLRTAAQTVRDWVVTQPAQPGSPAVWDWRDVVVTPGRNENYSVVIAPSTVVTDHIPAVTRVDRVQVEVARPARYENRTEFVRDGRNENITGNVTLERDRMYVFTGLRRPPGKTHDMVMNVKHNLNATVTNITAVHVIDRFRGLGQMHVVPVSSNTRPDGSVDLNFNYTRPGTAESTLYVRLHLANGGFVEVEADIPVNGLTFTERSNAPPLRLDAAVAKEGTLGF